MLNLELKNDAQAFGMMPHHSQKVEATAYRSLIGELAASVRDHDMQTRADVLHRLTDLFVAGFEGFSGEQLALFDDLMCRLVCDTGSLDRVTFARRVAKIAKVPPRVARMLALDISIDVAGPVLSSSPCLDEETLILAATSQRHMFAISQRKTLGVDITDLLVEQGDREVLIGLAGNAGASLSWHGCVSLVARAKEDRDLALKLWSCSRMRWEHQIAVFRTAPEPIRADLEVADRDKALLVRGIIKAQTGQEMHRIQTGSSGYSDAEQQVRLLSQAGALTEHWLRKFAEASKLSETTVALSLLTNLPARTVDRILMNDCIDHVLILTKSAGFSWGTTRTLLQMRATVKGFPADEIDHCFDRFDRLKPDTARTAIQFCRLQERAVNRGASVGSSMMKS